MVNSAVDIQALSITLQQVITPLFWGTIVLATAVPIAAAAGGWVAGKIDKDVDKDRRQEQSAYDH